MQEHNEYEPATKKNKLSHPSFTKQSVPLIYNLPDELLALIFKYSSNYKLPIVCTRFRDLMYNEIYDCFFEYEVNFPSDCFIPNPLVVRRIILESFDESDFDYAPLEKFKNVTQLEISTVDSGSNGVINRVVKYFPQITQLTFGGWLNKEEMQCLSGLKKLEDLIAYDIENLEFKEVFELKSLKSFELEESRSYATYGYSENGPQNSFGFIQTLIKSAPQLNSIHFQPEAFCVSIMELFEIIELVGTGFEWLGVSVIPEKENEQGSRTIVKKMEGDFSHFRIGGSLLMEKALQYLLPNVQTINVEHPSRINLTVEHFEKIMTTTEFEDLKPILEKAFSEIPNYNDEEEDSE